MVYRECNNIECTIHAHAFDAFYFITDAAYSKNSRIFSPCWFTTSAGSQPEKNAPLKLLVSRRNRLINAGTEAMIHQTENADHGML